MSPTMSETANGADIVLPGTNYLEEPGTRVNFEGNVKEYAEVLPPPSGRSGWLTLCGLAGAFRLMTICSSVDALREKLKKAVRAGYGEFTPFYWNSGEPRHWRGPRAFQKIRLSTEAKPNAKYLTMLQRYKYDAGVIGIKHFRVSH